MLLKFFFGGGGVAIALSPSFCKSGAKGLNIVLQLNKIIKKKLKSVPFNLKGFESLPQTQIF